MVKVWRTLAGAVIMGVSSGLMEPSRVQKTAPRAEELAGRVARILDRARARVPFLGELRSAEG
eukprot:1262552-Amorphochlora_amoeboformis.AAC.1